VLFFVSNSLTQQLNNAQWTVHITTFDVTLDWPEATCTNVPLHHPLGGGCSSPVTWLNLATALIFSLIPTR
jgi:hypothetical protein